MPVSGLWESGGETQNGGSEETGWKGETGCESRVVNLAMIWRPGNATRASAARSSDGAEVVEGP